MTEPPFSEGEQLNAELTILQDPTTQLRTLSRTEPGYTTLPGQPRVSLDSASIRAYISSDLLTPELNKLARHLWLISTPRSSHISPLHHQPVRGRSIVVAENPQLHLVWSHNQIFIKPLPKYLLSHAFWRLYLSGDGLAPADRAAALGFLRSYSYLIRYESDFRLAQRDVYRLVPEGITWDAFARFIARFEDVRNSAVAPRYAYGELRLTRLNFYTRIFLFPKLTFHHIDAQWGAYFGRMFAPILFVFAVFSIVLNAMQVELAVQAGGGIGGPWAVYADVSQWFSVCTLLVAAVVVVVLLFLLGLFFVHDIYFARRVLVEEARRERGLVGLDKRKSGVI